MKLYHYVDQVEFDDIKENNRLRFSQPFYWDQSNDGKESFLTYIFSFNIIDSIVKGSNEYKETIKKIIRLINFYLSYSNYGGKWAPIPRSQDEADSNLNALNNVKTGILNELQISWHYFAACWSTDNNLWHLPIMRDKMAYIVCDVELNEPKEVALTYGNDSNAEFPGRMTFREIIYEDFGSNAVMNFFNENGRYVYDLFRVLTPDWANEKEIRHMISPNFDTCNNIWASHKFTESIPSNSCSIDELKECIAEYLLSEAKRIKKGLEEKWPDDDKGRRVLYWDIPSGFIKDIILKP